MVTVLALDSVNIIGAKETKATKNTDFLISTGLWLGKGMQVGKGDQGYNVHGFLNLNWALAWEGHASW